MNRSSKQKNNSAMVAGRKGSHSAGSNGQTVGERHIDRVVRMRMECGFAIWRIPITKHADLINFSDDDAYVFWIDFGVVLAKRGTGERESDNAD